MEEERCFRCDKNQEEVKLLDAVYNNEVVKICEECSLTEDVPIIRKPSSSQLIESEKPYTVKQRLRRMAGFKEEKQISVAEKIARKMMGDVKIDDLRKPKDYKAVLDEKFLLAKKRNVPVNLIDNYNWAILRERKRRKIDRKQLAEAIGESEIAVKMIENKELPDDALRIIAKIEQYFSIKLRRDDDRIMWPKLIKSKVEKPTDGREIGKTEAKIEKPAVVLKFDPETTRNITIDDLRKMKEERGKEAIEQAGKKALDLKKEINVSEMVWRAKEENRKIEAEKEDKNLIDSEIEFED